MPEDIWSDPVRAYYDARGESEWHRLDNPYEGAVEQELHRRAFEELLLAIISARLSGGFAEVVAHFERGIAGVE